MRILLVAPLFPPDRGVSTFRMKFFFDELSREHEVDVLKPGQTTSFEGKIKTIDRTLFGSFASSLRKRRRIAAVTRPLVRNYDLIIVSATPFGLYEIARAANAEGKKYILDLRDLPDLTTSEQKMMRPLVWLRLKSWLIDRYIMGVAKKAEALLCVGTIATALTQEKYRALSTLIVNVHNGFNLADLRYVRESKSAEAPARERGMIIVGCVGNIFNFRNTKELRDVLSALDGLGVKVLIKHWGKVGAELKSHINALKNVEYLSCEPVGREILLTKLHEVDCFLLPCSEDLIWEPTTSVFDYILFQKPILFTGLKNNEAYSILDTVGARVLSLRNITRDNLCASVEHPPGSEVLYRFSREFHVQRLLRIVKDVQRTMTSMEQRQVVS